MKIRKLSANDSKAYKSFRLYSLQETPQSFENAANDEAVLTDVEWALRVKHSESSYIVGAFINSRLIATAGFSRARKEKTRHKSFLWGVFVKQNYRGKGIATKLTQFILDEFKVKKDIDQLQLSVVANNTIALTLYQKLGFQQYGREADAIRVNGTSYDEILMSYIKVAKS